MTVPTPATPETARPKKKRRWLRRCLWTAGGIAVVIAVFHRPILRGTADQLVRREAAKLGMKLDWKLSGSMTDEIILDDVTVSGEPGAIVQNLTLDHAAVHFDPWKLRTTGPGTLVESLEIGRLDADVDLTKLPTPGPEQKPPGKPAPPPAVVVPRVEIQEINLRIKLPGGAIRIEKFALSITPDGKGSISLKHLEAPGFRTVSDVSGSIAATAHSLTITDLALWPGVLVERLALDLATLPQERVPIEVKGRQGTSAADIKLVVSGWSSELSATGAADLANVTAATLKEWGVPDGGSDWHADRAALEVSGPVLRPDLLHADLKLEAGSAQFGVVQMDGTVTRITFGDGKFRVSDLQATAAGNSVMLSLEASAPATWDRIAQSSGSAVWSLNAPQPERLIPGEPVFTGNVSGKGTVSFADLGLTGLSGDIAGRTLKVQGIPVESADVRLKQADRTLVVEQAAVRMNEQNNLSFSGSLGLAGDHPLQVRWQIDCLDLAGVPAAARGGPPFWPESGSVQSTGSASGSLKALSAQEWSKLQAETKLEAAGVKLRGALLELLTIEGKLEGGRATVPQMTVQFDDVNRITASGDLLLAGPGIFSGNVSAEIPEIGKLRPWAEAGFLPPVREGSAALQWSGRGEWLTNNIEGDGTLDVHGLRIEGMPELLGASAAVTQRGREIAVRDLDASAGPWRAAGTVSWTGTRIEIPGLTGFAGKEPVLQLKASLPFAPGRLIDPDQPIDLQSTITALDLRKLSAALGQKWPVAGTVDSALHAEGTLHTIAADFSLNVKKLTGPAETAGKVGEISLALKASLAKDRLTLDSSLAQQNLKPLSITGGMDLRLLTLLENPGSFRAMPFSVQGKLPATDLSFVAGMVPEVRSIKGTGEIDFSLTGSVDKPSWKGAVKVTASEVSLNGDSLPSVKDARLRLRADGTRLMIDEAGVLLAGGRLEAAGGAVFDTLDDPKIDVRVNAKQILVVRDENLSLRADAALTCQGNLSSAAVKGRIGLVRGRVFKEIEYLPLSLPNQLPPPPPPALLTKSGSPALPPPLDRWTFDVKITTQEPVRLLGNLAGGGIVADLNLRGTGAAPELTGTADLKDAWVQLPYSRITFPKGTVTFTRDAPFDPQVEVRGESLVGGRQVFLNVQGRALDPLIRFTSSPPLPEGEIATLLATGVVTDDLESSADVAAGRAAFLVLSDAYRKLFGQQRRSSAEPPRLSFEFSPFGNREHGRTISAVYEFNPKLRAIGRVGETGSFRGLLYYLIRFR